MLLVVDVGNTQTHFGLFRDGETTVFQHWRFSTVRESTGDELGAALANLLALRGLSFHDVDRSIVSSTVPQLSEQWTQMARHYLGHQMLVVGPTIRTGMPIRIDNPYEVGADRLVNAVAAYDRVQDTCVVVDFGTAITYDVVSAAGEYLGGIITPGAEISIDALYDRAAKLPKVELAEPRSLIGKSTVDAIRSGIVFGFAGQVEGIVSRLRDELGETTRVIATGGLAGVLVPFIRETIDEVDDLLTLTGLRLIWERNSLELGRRDADRSGPDASPNGSRRTSIAGIGTSGVFATVAARIRNAILRRSSGSSAARPRRTRRAGDGSRANTGASSISSGTSQASRASASISGRPRCRASSRSRRAAGTGRHGRAARARPARARRPPGRRAAAARRRRSAATARRRSSGSVRVRSRAWSARRSWNAAETTVLPYGASEANTICPGGTSENSAARSARDPPGGVEQQVREIGGDAPDPGEVADPGVGEDQPRVGELAGELDGVQAERRDPAAGVDQDRQRRSLASATSRGPSGGRA